MDAERPENAFPRGAWEREIPTYLDSRFRGNDIKTRSPFNRLTVLCHLRKTLPQYLAGDLSVSNFAGIVGIGQAAGLDYAVHCLVYSFAPMCYRSNKPHLIGDSVGKLYTLFGELLGFFLANKDLLV